ncbi:MAG: Uncharacterised protein [Rhodobiaceae bacterium UBA7378]|nr:MAG: Uncharacterised protein [Rhodobiaceae bacterium UBA7378]
MKEIEAGAICEVEVCGKDATAAAGTGDKK